MKRFLRCLFVGFERFASVRALYQEASIPECADFNYLKVFLLLE